MGDFALAVRLHRQGRRSRGRRDFYDPADYTVNNQWNFKRERVTGPKRALDRGLALGMEYAPPQLSSVGRYRVKQRSKKAKERREERESAEKRRLRRMKPPAYVKQKFRMDKGNVWKFYAGKVQKATGRKLVVLWVDGETTEIPNWKKTLAGAASLTAIDKAEYRALRRVFKERPAKASARVIWKGGTGATQRPTVHAKARPIGGGTKKQKKKSSTKKKSVKKKKKVVKKKSVVKKKGKATKKQTSRR